MNPNYPNQPTGTPPQGQQPSQYPPSQGVPQPVAYPQNPTYQQPTPHPTFQPAGYADVDPNLAPVDYLDSIAAPLAPKKTGPSKIIMIVVMVLGLLTVVITGMMIYSSQPTKTDRLLGVYMRMKTLQSVADEQQKKLRDNDLRNANSALLIILSNAIRDTEEPLQKAGVNLKKVPVKLTSAETKRKETLTTDFTDARLNVRLDSTYAREMAYQLSLLNAMMKTAYEEAGTKTIKTVLEGAYGNLEPMQQRFDNFTAAQE